MIYCNIYIYTHYTYLSCPTGPCILQAIFQLQPQHCHLEVAELQKDCDPKGGQ